MDSKITLTFRDLFYTIIGVAGIIFVAGQVMARFESSESQDKAQWGRINEVNERHDRKNNSLEEEFHLELESKSTEYDVRLQGLRDLMEVHLHYQNEINNNQKERIERLEDLIITKH